MNRYNVVLADPGWQFDNVKTGGSMTSGAEATYETTMSLREIQALPVLPVVARSAVLFLWVPTSLKFTHGPSVAAAWGFPHYITTLYWTKMAGRLGMGFWLRNACEELLLFKRGDPRPFRHAERNVIDEKVGEHSAKPIAFRHLIERATVTMTPPKRLELFARERAEGWTCLGNEIPGYSRDLRESLPALAKTLALGGEAD